VSGLGLPVSCSGYSRGVSGRVCSWPGRLTVSDDDRRDMNTTVARKRSEAGEYPHPVYTGPPASDTQKRGYSLQRATWAIPRASAGLLDRPIPPSVAAGVSAPVTGAAEAT
jgi:hypothetical protein